MTVQTQSEPVPSHPRPGGQLAVFATPRLQDVVQQLGVHDPLDPPTAPLLPPGAVPVARIAHPHGWDEEARAGHATALAELLALLGLPEHDLFAAGGMVVWGMSLPTPRNDWWVSVDYQCGAVDPTGDAEGRSAAKRGLLLNHEAGRCHTLHPLADEAARDRRYAPVPDDLPWSLAQRLHGTFVSTGTHQQSVRRDGTTTSDRRDNHGQSRPAWLRILLGHWADPASL